MNIFEEACSLSSERWVDSFPNEAPKHKFSKKHNKKMSELFEQAPKGDKRKSSKNTIKFLLIAAVLLSITITAFAFASGREFVVSRFSNHSQYEVAGEIKAKRVKSFEVNYIPNGFEMVEESKSKYNYCVNYEKDDKNFSADKVAINGAIDYDTENFDDKIIYINGIEAIYFRSNNDYGGIIFNDGDYIFMISGNIGEEELVKIAQSVK